MPEFLTKALPFLTKSFALIVGSLVSLVLSGDIDLDARNNAKLTINLKIILKITLCIGLGLFLGEFTIDYFDFRHLNYYAQAMFYMIASAFGLLIVGIGYRAVQLTFSDKSFSEIVAEVKNITKALLK